MQEVFAAQPELENLLLAEAFCQELSAKQTAWRRVCTLSVVAGITASTHMAALAYMDSYRCGRSPSALIQCLRDATMGEGFERLDKEKGMLFSCRWNKWRVCWRVALLRKFPRVVVGFHDASHFFFGRVVCKSEDGGLLFSVCEECGHGHGLIG